jgi:hypothetical protein
MGNRGCLHDNQGHIRRRFNGQRWIICLLEYKARKRSIMMPGQYTELFFLDEATALAAGHRPCAQCQPARFNLFREIWAKTHLEAAQSSVPTAPALDLALHKERIASSAASHRFYGSVEKLPDGTFVTNDERNSYLVFRSQLLRWEPTGYEDPFIHPVSFPVRVLTPCSIVRVLGGGYSAGIHPSALHAIRRDQF